MSEKYNHPPIEEAIFDIRIRSEKPFTKQLFDDFLKHLKKYSPIQPMRNINIDVTTRTQQEEITAYRARSQDQKHIVQFTKDGFSFSRLKPYNDWDTNYCRALDLWSKYCQVMEPQAITRVATRFINNLQIRHIFTKPQEYFNTYIQYDNALSPVWNQMSYRLFMSHTQGIKSHIIFDSQINQNTQSVNVIFDIDVFCDNLALSYKNDTNVIEDIFSQLRKVKNSIFEKSITDKIREIIK